MTEPSEAATFEPVTSISGEPPTLIEGLPGHGLVAAIAVDQITDQLGLTHYGNIASEDFPPVVTFEGGRVQDLVRVYAGTSPDVMTLKSDLVLPPTSFEPLSRCVLNDLAPEFDRAIFLVGAPAENDSAIGEVRAVTTSDALDRQVRDAGIAVHEDPGLVGGITGALMRACYQASLPAILLIVRAHPFLPDPVASKALIEDALEPLVDFDIDTSDLDEHAEEIRRRLDQIAEQYRQMTEEQVDERRQPATGMFQ